MRAVDWQDGCGCTLLAAWMKDQLVNSPVQQLVRFFSAFSVLSHRSHSQRFSHSSINTHDSVSGGAGADVTTCRSLYVMTRL